MTFDPFKGKTKVEDPAAQVEFNKAIAQVFSHPLGEYVLGYIRNRTIERSVCPPGCAEGYGYFREGQNDLVRQIEDAIKRGKEGK
jgi:hypothetical protein